jgi:tetratricopeptide (TPR) repeat protein
LEFTSPAAQARKFDFSLDYRVINQLAETLFDLAKQYPVGDETRGRLIDEAIGHYQKTLQIDSENEMAHYGLYLIYQMLDNPAQAEHHQRLHEKYKLDDNARDVAIIAARQKYPAANHAAEAVVINDLRPRANWMTSVQGYRLGVDLKPEQNQSMVHTPLVLNEESHP